MDSTTSTTKTYTIDLGEQSKETGEYGWICPVCGRGVAPSEKTCPCKEEYKYIPYPAYPWTYPTYPIWYGGPMCDAVNVWPRSTEKVTKVTTSTNGETNG